MCTVGEWVATCCTWHGRHFVFVVVFEVIFCLVCFYCQKHFILVFSFIDCDLCWWILKIHHLFCFNTQLCDVLFVLCCFDAKDREKVNTKHRSGPRNPCNLLCLCLENWNDELEEEIGDTIILLFAELGTRQHCRDNVTMFSGLKVCWSLHYYYILVAILHFDTDNLTFFEFFMSLKLYYVIALSLLRS